MNIKEQIQQLKETKLIYNDWFNQEMVRLRKECPHPEEARKHHPDASGNNDSWDECTDCGAEI